MENLVERIAPVGDKDADIIKDSAVALFEKPKVSSSILSNDYVTFDRTSPHSDTASTFNFHLPASMLPRYCDLKSMVVCAKVNVVKKNEEGKFVPVTMDDNVCPPNFFLATLFKSVSIRINGGLVYTSAEQQPAINLLSRLLNGSHDSLQSYAELEGGWPYYDSSISLQTNVGYYANCFKYAASATSTHPTDVWLMGPLNHSFESSNSILANNAAIDVQLVRNDDKTLLTVGPKTQTEQFLLGTTTYHVRIKEISLHVKVRA